VHVLDNPVRLLDPDGRSPEDWYEDEQGNIVYNPYIKSQADLDAAGIKGKYLGTLGIGIDEESGEMKIYLYEGKVINRPVSLPMIIISSKAQKYIPGIDDIIVGAGELGKRGEKLMRTTTPLKTTGKIKYYTTGWRGNQHVKTEKVLNKGVLKVARKAPALGALISTADIWKGLAEDGVISGYKINNENIGINTTQEIVGFAGSIGGGWIGAEIGFWTGASIGSFVPGVGNAIGGVVGGVIGGVIGAWVGEMGSEKIVTKMSYKK